MYRKEPVLLSRQYKNHTVQNAVESLELENLPQNAQDVHLQPIRNLSITIQVLDTETEEVLETIVGKATSGSVKAESSSLVRRSASLSLIVDETLFPGQNSLIWFNRKIKMYAGLQDLSKHNEYINFLLGTFWIDDVGYKRDAKESTIDLTLTDKMGQYIDTELENPMKINIDTPISEAMKSIMEHLGETKFGYMHTSPENEVVPYILEFAVGDKTSKVIETLRDMYMDYVCGYNIAGEFEFKKINIQKEDDTADSKWRFDTINNDRADLTVSFSESYNLANIRNRILVFGGANETTGLTPSGEVRVTDPKSPFNVYAIGERTRILTESKYANDEQCISKGRYEIWKASTFQEKATITCLPIYFLDTYDIIDVVHPETKQTSRYIVDSFNYDLKIEGTMSISASKMYYTTLEYGEEKVPLVDAIIRGISNNGWLSLGEERIKACYNIMGSGKATMTVRFQESVDGGTQASVTSYPTTKNQTMMIDLADFSDLDFDDENGYVTGKSKGDYMDRVLGHEMLHAVQNDYLGHDMMVVAPIWFKEGFAELLHGAKERFVSVMETQSAKGVTGEAFRTWLTDRAHENLKGTWEGDSADYVSSYLIAAAIYRLCDDERWTNLFIRLKTQSNPGINFLLKLLPIAETNDDVIELVIAEAKRMTTIWDRLEDKNEIDTMSIGGKYFMNLFGVSLTAETVFNNADANEVSIGFETKFEK